VKTGLSLAASKVRHKYSAIIPSDMLVTPKPITNNIARVEYPSGVSGFKKLQ
jgi:hypothetical protein